MDLTNKIRQATTEEMEQILIEIFESNDVYLLHMNLRDYYLRKAHILSDSGKAEEAILANVEAMSFIGEFNHIITSPRNSDNNILIIRNKSLDWQDVSTDGFLYLWNICKRETTHPIIKSHHLAVLWQYKKNWIGKKPELPKPIDVAILLIENLKIVADIINSREIEPLTKGMEISRYMNVAVYLASLIGRDDLMSTLRTKLQYYSSTLIDTAPHWSLDLVELEIHLASNKKERNETVVSNDRVMEIDVELDRIIRSLKDHKDITNERDAIDLKERLRKISGKVIDPKDCFNEKGDALSEYANKMTGLASHLYWKEAAISYQSAGNNDKLKLALEEARKAIVWAEENGEFKEIRVDLKIEPDKIEKAVEPFFSSIKDPSEILLRISHKLFATSLENTTAKISEKPPRSLVSQLFMTMPMVDDRSLSTLAPDTPELELYEIKRDLLYELEIGSALFLQEIIRKAIEEHNLSASHILTVLSSSPFLEKDDFAFFTVAADRFMREDYVSFIHVIIPRIEQMIRRILKTAGAKVTVLDNRGAMKEMALGQLIRSAFEEGFLPKSYALFFQATLSEEWGNNLRNKTAHGFLKEDECSFKTAVRVLHIALLVCGFRLVSK